MIAGARKRSTESGLQAHPPTSRVVSLQLAFDFRLLCNNRAVHGRLFDSVSALDDPLRAFA